MEEKMIVTNMGKIPLNDYLNIIAMQSGFDSCEEMQKAGCHANVNEEEAK